MDERGCDLWCLHVVLILCLRGAIATVARLHQAFGLGEDWKQIALCQTTPERSEVQIVPLFKTKAFGLSDDYD